MDQQGQPRNSTSTVMQSKEQQYPGAVAVVLQVLPGSKDGISR